jgi:quercetin dioxygenase-like cupin family protein
MLNRCGLKPDLVLGTAMLMAASIHAPVGGAAPESGKILAESRFTLTDAPVQAALVQLVVDFLPGAWTSVHMHGGQAINLVLEGEITLRHGSHDQPHQAGQAWTDEAGVVHAAGNTGSGKARLLTNFLLPEGAAQITAIQESAFEPTVLYHARVPISALPAATEIVQQVVDLPPGARARRAYYGFVAALVVDGEVSVEIGAEQKRYKAGESWFAQTGTRMTSQNTSTGNTRVFMTYLLSTAGDR